MSKDELKFPDYRQEAVDQFIKDEESRNEKRKLFSINKAKEIMEGFGNLIVSPLADEDDKIEEMYLQRISVCQMCPSLSDSGSRCGECGCILAAKGRSTNSDCPLGKWPKIIENNSPKD